MSQWRKLEAGMSRGDSSTLVRAEARRKRKTWRDRFILAPLGFIIVAFIAINIVKFLIHIPAAHREAERQLAADRKEREVAAEAEAQRAGLEA